MDISMKTARLDRRHFLKGAAGLAGATAMGGWTGGGAMAQSAGQVVVSNWGGDWNDRTVRFVEDPLTQSKGLTIVRDLATEAERKAKLLAERRIRRSSVDVIHLNSSDAFEVRRQEAIGDIDTSRIVQHANLVSELTTPYFLPWLYSGVVIIYDRDKVKDVPTSYADLWDERFAGRVGLTNQLYFNYMMMAGLIAKGDMTSVDAGRDRLVELREKIQPRIYATHQQMATGFANGEIDVAVNYKARGAQWAAGGLPLGLQYPDEGAIAIAFGACLPQNSPNPDGAYEYFNAMVDPTAMAGLAAASFYAPSNKDAKLSDELHTVIDFSEEERSRLKFPDFNYVAEHTAEWLDWWNRSVARG